MTSASGGQRSIQLSYGRYAVERGAILMMGTHLVYYFLSLRINRLFFHRFWLFKRFVSFRLDPAQLRYFGSPT